MIRSAADTIEIKEQGAAPATGVAFFLLMKPGIVAAVVLSGYAGMVVALGSAPQGSLACLCLASVALAAAGSAMLNNVLDRRMDLMMERVQKRSAALASLGTPRVTGCALCLVAAGVLTAAHGLNLPSTLFLLAAVLSYTLYYTLFLKRRSHWAAILGGIPGALPVLVGQAAVAPPFGRGTLILFLVMLLWQPPHFWMLSLVHLEEYRRAGVPVLPLVKGERFTKVAIATAAAFLVASTLLLWGCGPCSAGYAVWALLTGALFLAACCTFLRSERHYRLAFTSSIVYLVAILAGVVVDSCL